MFVVVDLYTFVHSHARLQGCGDEGIKPFEQCKEIGCLLGSMKDQALDFCRTGPPVLRESLAASFLFSTLDPFEGTG
jgi:hypothetical protein